MKVAMTVWGNRISPVFDSAQTILLAEIENNSIVYQQREFLPRLVAWQLARMLVERGIDTLICGAISDQPAQIIKQADVSLLSFVSGNAEQFLEAFAANKSIKPFKMPGSLEDLENHDARNKA